MTSEFELAAVDSQEGSAKSRGGKAQSTVYAGFWWRLASFLVDFPVLFLLSAVLAALATKAGAGTGGGVPRWLALLILALVSWAYYAGFESSSWRATPGKRLFGMRVTDTQGRRISLLRASIRAAGRCLSWSIFLAGYLMMVPQKKKQTLHDKLAKTFVLRKVNAAPILRLFSWMALHQRNLIGRHSTVVVAATCIATLATLLRLASIAMEPQILAGNAKTGVYQAVSEAKKAQDYVATQFKATDHYPGGLPDDVVKTIQLPGGSELRYAPQTGYLIITFSANPYLVGRSLTLAPIQGRTGIVWACSAFGIDNSLLPRECRQR